MSSQECILVRNCPGKKREKGLLKTSTSRVDVLQGTLLVYMCINEDYPKTQQVHVLECLDIQENIEVQCTTDDFKHLNKDEYELLRAVPTCQDRYSIFQNGVWLREGLELKEDDIVEVYDKPSAKDLIGKLRYKGPIEGLQGTYFGVELIHNPGQGVSDGTFRNQKFFQCARDSAMFVGLHRIRRCENPPAEPTDPIKTCNLAIGERIVWISETGAEFGQVKWIGRLPDCKDFEDITVGVEFDNPVGTGTGKLNNQRLFHAKQRHASLVPLMGLMKASDYYKDDQASGDVGLPEDVTLGKTKDDVIEEQRHIMEQLHIQNNTAYTQNGGNKEYSEQRRGDPDIRAEVHPVPPSQSGSKISNQKHVNPLYEYNRSKSEYLPGDLASTATTTTELSSSGSKSQPNSERSKSSHIAPDPELDVGSLVEVMSSKPLYGLIKWIGNLPDQKDPKKLIAGLEMEEEIAAGTDGTFGGHRKFHCPSRKGFFVPLYKCRKDKRFLDQCVMRSMSYDKSINFGSNETPDLEGTVSPPDSLEDVTLICGKGRGIQGHHNSCYMDATLLAMFYFTTVFDSILHRPKTSTDLPEYTEIQQVLKEGIVNPLRKHHYVRADKMMKLRKLLHQVGKIPGMMSEEKDPEEFLNLLLNEITRAEPFLKISAEDCQDVQHTFFYQLIMEKDEQLVLPTTQQLFELSFLQLGIKLKEVPSCLIIQMPRFGKDYKMYRRILPSLELDITDVLENAPRECIICGDLAVFECKECYQVHGAGLNTIAFCEGCKGTSHQHKLRVNHRCRPISVPPLFKDMYYKQKVQNQPMAIPREKMELFAVICIQTSHYVSFVKTGQGNSAKWIFFDSMADRMGEQSGYNIPEVQECSEIPRWLSDECFNDIMKNPEDKCLPEFMRRLICDAYICMYQSPEVMMFR